VRFHQIIYIAVIAALALLWYGCANIVPPEGGKKDETPPVLLSITPADSGLNARPSKIELHFNKYMEVKDLEKNLQLSPLLPITPTILSYGKRVVISIQDTQLLDNTTYRIGLGDALVDNREANPYKGFVYMFSTGSYFDSLELHGRVFDAATGRPDTAALITLYAANESDTAVLRKKPMYASRTDASGNFSFKSLPQKQFKMYAIQDGNNNYIYEYGEEKIGFLDNTVVPALGTDTAYTFHMFKEVIDTTSAFGKEQAAEDSSRNVDRSNRLAGDGIGKPSAGGERKPPKNNFGYRVNVDTSNIGERTFELDHELTIDLFTELQILDTAKVYLSYENGGIEVESLRKLAIDSGKIKINSEWQGNKIYTLRLIKGWAKDTSGSELPPGKYFFHTKGDEDYGILKIHTGKQFSNDSFLLQVYKGPDSIYLKPITDSIITLTRLQPGEYGMRIIVDGNRNHKWDSGDLLKKLQPERVIGNQDVLNVKAGWENEFDFTPASYSKSLSGKKDKHFGERQGATKPGENSSQNKEEK
jgi:hypothetical protein